MISFFFLLFQCAVYSQGPRDPARVCVVVEERLMPRLPTFLLAAVSDDHVLSVDRFYMSYELKQFLTTFLLR